ncbi:MAG TPA: Uma2 family endonuclease [Longimicrobiales bacterium]|nr:Uma2 family endonuclease [Longimicrobiales bacterium]
MSSVAEPRITPREYLERERSAEYRSEYVNGRVYAMTGASRAHNVITVNASRELSGQLGGRPCEVYASAMRVKVGPTGLYTYPDVVVVCGTPAFEDRHADTLLGPGVIIEVLSPSTAGYDRGEKFAHYRRLASLREYVLVSQDRMRVEHYARQGERWVLTELNAPEHVVALESIGCTLRLGDLYERVELPPPDELPIRS